MQIKNFDTNLSRNTKDFIICCTIRLDGNSRNVEIQFHHQWLHRQQDQTEIWIEQARSQWRIQRGGGPSARPPHWGPGASFPIAVQARAPSIAAQAPAPYY